MAFDQRSQAAGEVAEVADDEGYFFRASLAARPETTQGALPEGEQDVQKWLSELESLDKKLLAARDRAEQARHNAARADLLEKIATASEKPEDQAQWIQQLADTVSAAAQTGAYPDGVTRLAALHARATKDGNDELAAYINFRYLTAEYGVSLQSPSADFRNSSPLARKPEKVHHRLSQKSRYGRSPAASGHRRGVRRPRGRSQALVQPIVDNFPNAASAKKGAGAIARSTRSANQYG